VLVVVLTRHCMASYMRSNNVGEHIQASVAVSTKRTTSQHSLLAAHGCTNIFVEGMHHMCCIATDDVLRPSAFP
jgi:hypothetical protein